MTTLPLQKKIQGQAYRIVKWQLACIGLLSLITSLVFSKKIGFSIFSGGMAYGLPNLLFVFVVFRYTSAQQMIKFMSAFFLGEMVKLVLSGILFLLVVKYLTISLLSVLIGFIAAMVAFWVVCLMFCKKKMIVTYKGAVNE